VKDGNTDVAIKLIRNNDLMEKAGLKEMVRTEPSCIGQQRLLGCKPFAPVFLKRHAVRLYCSARGMSCCLSM
jgi:hypothetical protein